MKKKRIALVVIGVIVILLAINFFVNGFEFSIYGVCSFNSKYYDSPKIAFEQNEEIDISEDIGICRCLKNISYILLAFFFMSCRRIQLFLQNTDTDRAADQVASLQFHIKMQVWSVIVSIFFFSSPGYDRQSG